MSLETMIRTKWSEDAALNALIPVERVTTSWPARPLSPLAVLRIGKRTRVARANTGEAFDRIDIGVEIWGETRGEADSAGALARELLDSAAEQVDGETRRLRFIDQESTLVDGSRWRTLLQFRLSIGPIPAS